MKQCATLYHLTPIDTLDWNSALKKQVAALLEATLGPAFGPENDDEPGCSARPIWPDKNPDDEDRAPKVQARPFFPSEDEGEDGDEDDSFSLRPVPPLTQQKTFGDEGGDTGWSPVKAQARPSFPDDDDGNGRTPHLIPLAGPEGNDGGWDAPIFGDEGSHDWDAPMKCRSIRWGREDEEDAAIKAHVTFDPEGDEDEEDGPFLFARPTWAEEDEEDSDGRQPGFGDNADDDPDWGRAPHTSCKRRLLRIKFGDEDCRRGGWSTARAHVLFPPDEPDPDGPIFSRFFGDEDDRGGTGWSTLAPYQPQEESPFLLGGNFSQNRATRSPRVAVLTAPRLGRDDDEAAPRFGKDDDED